MEKDNLAVRAHSKAMGILPAVKCINTIASEPPEPVSSTHLDVYQRHILQLPASEAAVLQSIMDDLSAVGFELRDVYKRQVKHCVIMHETD